MRLTVLLLMLTGLASTPEASSEAAVAAVLDDWHAAAAAADEARYFAHFAPDAVFLGTDATERWAVEDFRRYAHPYFAKGKAWSFKAVERHISFSPDRSVAWFDERLDTPNLGPARGSGVLVRAAGSWRIAHYDLSVPIPNALMKEIKQRIEEIGKAKGAAR
ncbi:MAG TPA: nuclear transport factor 2 family protein [Thermoanaerobaculia bacterium]|nr:nuclear transport factor 2 family protein [Thermoanaerobaculia bacterium]